MTRLADHLLNLDDPPVKALVVYQANPMGSNPDQKRVREGLMREDLFTVVMEQFPTDTVDYADIVLPATMQTEHLDVNDGYGHFYIHLNRPAVRRRGEALSTLETFRRIARAMDLDEPALYASDEEVARTLLGDDLFDELWDDGLEALPARAVRRRSPTASRRRPASSSSTPRRRSGTGWTRSPATRRHRPPRRTRTTRSR